MKVKDVIEFLSKCNPNAEFISEDHNGYNHALDELYFGRCISSDKESGIPVSSDCVYAVFKDEYFKLVDLLDYRALTYWGLRHYDHNSLFLEDIEVSYDHLKTKEYERDLYFEDLVNAFNRLYIFDLSSSEIEGLSSKSIANLTEYNSIIESFKNKFNEIKDELATKVGVSENS